MNPTKAIACTLLLLARPLVAAEAEPEPVPEPEVQVVTKFVDELEKAVGEGDQKKVQALIHRASHDFFSDEAAISTLFGERWAAPVDFKIKKIAYFKKSDGLAPPGLDPGKFPETPQYLIEVTSEGTTCVYFLATEKEGLKLIFRATPAK
jgi:hypothetical protein